jgi:putative endonuclease
MVDINMYYVYLIKSISHNWNYIGFTESINRRLIEHNKGNCRSTKYYKPFELEFVQIVNCRLEARNLEKFLKIRFNKESLLKFI